jgi:hypothetical protein
MLVEAKALKKPFFNNKNKQPVFQVLLIDNDETEDVQVEEAQKVNYFKVKEHLKQGGSVFITTNNKQKLIEQKTAKTKQSYVKAQRTYGRIMKAHLKTCKNM